MRWFMLLICYALLLIATNIAYSGAVCDGTDDLLTPDITSDNFITATDGTLAVWVKPTGSAPDAGSTYYYGSGIIGNAAADFGMWRAVLNSVDVMYVAQTGATPDTITSAYANDTWTHLAWTHTGGALSFYRDGVLIGTSSAGDTPGLTAVLNICTIWAIKPYFQGSIASIHTYSIALTANEVATLGKSRLLYPGLSRAATAYWPLDDCTPGTTADGVGFIDRSGNGRTTTGSDGADNVGLTCIGSEILSYPWGAY